MRRIFRRIRGWQVPTHASKSPLSTRKKSPLSTRTKTPLSTRTLIKVYDCSPEVEPKTNQRESARSGEQPRGQTAWGETNRGDETNRPDANEDEVCVVEAFDEGEIASRADKSHGQPHLAKEWGALVSLASTPIFAVDTLGVLTTWNKVALVGCVSVYTYCT